MNEDLLLIKQRREREFRLNKEIRSHQQEKEMEKLPPATVMGRLPTVMELGRVQPGGDMKRRSAV